MAIMDRRETATMVNDIDEEWSQRFNSQKSLVRQHSQLCKLLGRSAEESILLNAYFASLSSISISSDVPAAVVLICGESGQGKTKLAESIRQTVIEDDGYFIRGKFDQNISSFGSSSAAAANLPYSAVSSAFGEYCAQLEKRGFDDWQEVASAMTRRIRKDERELLCEAIPTLSKLLACGDDDNYSRRSSEWGDEEDHQDEGMNNISKSRSHRLNYLLKKCVGVIAAMGEPVVFLINDMQWADASSLEIIRKLVLGAKNPFTFVFTYRPIHESHPFSQVVQEFSKSNMRITEIMLSSLRKRFAHELVMKMLRLDDGRSNASHDECTALSNFVFHATSGNPFFIREQIISLCDSGLLWHDGSSWLWDIEKIKQSNVLSDIVSMVFDKMVKLPKFIRTVLVVCACIGATVDLSILHILTRKIFSDRNPDESENGFLTDKAISIACEEGLLVKTQDGMSVKFFHDSIQSAAYSLLEDEKRSEYHLMLGRILFQKLVPNAWQSPKYLFIIASQLARGHEFITSNEERIGSARIFLQAGDVSRGASAFQDGFFYFKRAVTLLRDEDWVDEFQLCCDVFLKGAEVASFTGNYQEMDVWVDAIVVNSGESVDVKFRAYQIQIMALFGRDEVDGAVYRGLEALKLVGIHFPTKNLPAHVLIELFKTRRLLRGIELGNLAPIQDTKMIPALRLLDLLCTMTAANKKHLLALFTFKVVQLNLEYGLSTGMPTAICIYGYILDRMGFSLSDTTKCAETALSLQDHLSKHNPGVPETKSHVTMVTYGSTLTFTTCLVNCLEPLLSGYRAGLETGDIIHGILCGHFYGWFSFHTGQELNGVLASLKKFGRTISEYSPNHLLLSNQVYQQAVANFLGCEGASPNKASLQGSIFDFNKVFSGFCWTAKHQLLFNHAKLMQMITAYYFGHYDLAWAMSEELRDFGSAFGGLLFQFFCAFYRGMTAVTLLQVSNLKQYRTTARICLKMLKRGQKKSPINLTHHLYILKAECAALKKKFILAEKFYLSAIEQASTIGVLHERALAHERFGHFHFLRSNHDVAYVHIREAHKLYLQWGSQPKCALLNKRFPHLSEEPRDPKNPKQKKFKRFSFTKKVASFRGSELVAIDE